MSEASLPRTWRRTAAAAGVGAMRLRSWPGQALLVAAGIALATALFVAILGGSLVAQDRALQRAINELPAQDRSFRVDIFGLPIQQPFARDDHAARAAVSTLGASGPVRVSFVHDALIDGEYVRLVAVDGLSRFVSMRDGRLPGPCEQSRCEVLQVGDVGRPHLREGGIDLVRTGIATVPEPRALGPAFEGLHTYGTQEGVRSPVVLLTASTEALERLPSLQLLFRVRSWIAPLPGSGVRPWTTDDVLARETRAGNALHEADPAFKLTGPDDALLAARDRGTVSARRMQLLGAAASVLLFGFVLVAAMGLRRGISAERKRMLQRGATRSQVLTALGVEVGALTFLAWLAGVAIGSIVTVALARHVGMPPLQTLRHALLERATLLALLATLAGAACLVFATVLSREESPRGRRITALDIAALGALLAIVVGVRHAGLGADALATGASPTIVLLLPLLVCFLGAVAAARLLGPAMHLAERVSRRAPPTIGLALTALARAPARTATACAFLVVAVGLALFAAAYRATLERGVRDEAGFQVPLDATSVGRTPVETGETRGTGGKSIDVYPVLRRSADIASTGTSAQGVTVLGVPPGALERMYWRSDFSTSRSELVSKLEADGSTALRGTTLPSDATSVVARLQVRGAPLLVELVVVDAAGAVRMLPLGRAASGATTLTGGLSGTEPHRGRLRIAGLELSLTRNGTNWFFHLDHEGRLVRAPDGRFTLVSLVAKAPSGRSAHIDTHGWVSHGAAGRIERRRPLRFAYAFDEAQSLVVRAPQETDGRALAVVASPDVATSAGASRLALDFGGLELAARVVGVARRFPTVGPGEPFVVVDESRLATALAADAPGTSSSDEAWVAGRGGSPLTAGTAAWLRGGSPGASVVFRQEVAWALQQDPLGRSIGYTLAAAALLALVLAIAGLWVTVLGDLHDERHDLADLEGQGANLGELRQHVRVRALALLGFGILAGVALGAVLTRLVVALLAVSAGTSVPDPPLVLELEWSNIVLAGAVLVVAAVLVVELTLRVRFREDEPLGERAALG